MDSSYEFGADHYFYQAGRRQLHGATRTIRPMPGETVETFRQRVDEIAQQLESQGDSITMDEELRAGSITQCVIRVTHTAHALPARSMLRSLGGRPSAPRGKRGGS